MFQDISDVDLKNMIKALKEDEEQKQKLLSDINKLQESYEASTASIKQFNIDRQYLNEVKNYRKAPAGVTDVTFIVALIVGIEKADWATCANQLFKSHAHLLKILQNYDVEKANLEMLEHVKSMVDSNDLS